MRRTAPASTWDACSDPVQALRMVARLPTATPSSMGYFYSPRRSRDACASSLARERFDLIFVHCSSVAQYVEHVRGIPKILDFGDMDSQKWLEYAQYKPFPLSLGYALEGSKLEREEKRLARRFDMCTATTRAEWETLEGYGTGVADRLVPQRRRCRILRAARRCATSRIPSSSSGAWTTTRTRSACSSSASARLPLLRERRPGIKLLIVGADPSPAVRRLARACRA